MLLAGRECGWDAECSWDCGFLCGAGRLWGLVEEDGARSPRSEKGPGLLDGRVRADALSLCRGRVRAGVRGLRRDRGQVLILTLILIRV